MQETKLLNPKEIVSKSKQDINKDVRRFAVKELHKIKKKLKRKIDENTIVGFFIVVHKTFSKMFNTNYEFTYEELKTILKVDKNYSNLNPAISDFLEKTDPELLWSVANSDITPHLIKFLDTMNSIEYGNQELSKDKILSLIEIFEKMVLILTSTKSRIKTKDLNIEDIEKEYLKKPKEKMSFKSWLLKFKYSLYMMQHKKPEAVKKVELSKKSIETDLLKNMEEKEKEIETALKEHRLEDAEKLRQELSKDKDRLKQTKFKPHYNEDDLKSLKADEKNKEKNENKDKKPKETSKLDFLSKLEEEMFKAEEEGDLDKIKQLKSLVPEEIKNKFENKDESYNEISKQLDNHLSKTLPPIVLMSQTPEDKFQFKKPTDLKSLMDDIDSSYDEMLNQEKENEQKKNEIKEQPQPTIQIIQQTQPKQPEPSQPQSLSLRDDVVKDELDFPEDHFIDLKEILSKINKINKNIVIIDTKLKHANTQLSKKAKV